MDDDLYIRVNNHNKDAWKDLFNLYYAPLCSYVSSIIDNQYASEDVVQETLVNIWNSNYVFSNMKHMTYYLYKSVYNNALYYMRSNHKFVSLENTSMDDLLDDDAFASSVKEELTRRLYNKIQELPKQCKNVILLSIDGLSGEEIAKKLDISINTVKVHKRRAMEILKEQINKNPIIFLL